MDFKELKNKTENELHRLLAESRDKLRELRFKDAGKQLKNVREIRSVREAIARILTLINSTREAGEKKSEQAEVKKEDNK